MYLKKVSRRRELEDCIRGCQCSLKEYKRLYKKSGSEFHLESIRDCRYKLSIYGRELSDIKKGF